MIHNVRFIHVLCIRVEVEVDDDAESGSIQDFPPFAAFVYIFPRAQRTLKSF